MYPLSLQINLDGWRVYVVRKADPAFRRFEQKVFHRDNFVCQFCGFQAHKYQEVVNIDGNYRNNKLSNLATACCFCTQCFFIESAGVGEYGGGSLIFLPEIAQADINSFCHVLFCAITNDTGYKASAQQVYRSMRLRSQIIEDKFGEGTSDPVAFARLIIESEQSTDELCKNLLKDVRLLPSRAKFRKQIEYWAAAALEELSAEPD